MDDGLSFLNDLLWILFLSGFTIYYVKTFVKQGITLFGFHVLLHFYISVCLMYPFAFQVGNTLSVGGQYNKIVYVADKACLLTFLGMGLMLLGYFASKNFVYNERARSLCLTVYDNLVNSWLTKTGLLVSLGILLATTIFMMASGFQFLAGRMFSMENTDFRPLFNSWAVMIFVFAIAAFVVGMARRQMGPILIGLFICFMGLMGGTRGASVEPAMTAFVIYAMATRLRRASVIGGFAGGFMALAVLVGFLRQAASSGVADDAHSSDQWIDSLIYGGNFSDLRDYAWILSGFEDQFYYGKTFIAGFLGFVPSSVFVFRNEYGIGRISTSLAGIYGFHGGLRGTEFAEVYLNFGIPGLLIVCPLFGVILERINHWTHWTIANRPELNPYAVGMAGVLVMHLAENTISTAGFYSNYILFLLWVVGSIMIWFFNKQKKIVPRRAV